MASIIATAWELAHEQGIGGVTLHGLARAVGIRQPSLYEYFDSKLALFDAMFADGNRQLLARFDALPEAADPRAAVKACMQAFIAFNVEDPERTMLLFSRPIPGFEPSEGSYALAREVLERAVTLLNAAGMTDPDDIDCFIAMIAGLMDAQISNDPGGTRWIRHLDRLVDFHLDDALPEAPVNPKRITRPAARVLAEEEFRRFAELCADLTPEEWELPTDCTAWNVRQMVLHVLGSAEAQARVPELIHQFRRGLPMNKQIDSHHWVDGMNELQIRERAHLTDREIATQMQAIGPRAVRGRWKTPLPVRYLPLPFGAPVGWVPLKYLLDVGFTRDVWAHRIDLAAATGRPMDLTPDHDGLLAADIADEWAAIHRLALDLELTGPAGGSYRYGSGGERLEIDAIEFVRILSGRHPGAGVLAHPLPL